MLAITAAASIAPQEEVVDGQTKQTPSPHEGISLQEARFDPLAVGSAGERGVFQIHGVHAGRVEGSLDRLFRAEVNVRVAHELWLDQGWEPWTCKPRGS